MQPNRLATKIASQSKLGIQALSEEVGEEEHSPRNKNEGLTVISARMRTWKWPISHQEWE